MNAAGISPATLEVPDFRLIPKMFFGPGGTTADRREHAPSALGSERGDFAIL